ncbi:hypothetical protein R2D22_34915 [Streptomyces sp. HUAS YS2]|uniref:Secreted protein n=2 Tax=Streptomyces solicathayae TaxID=3081768 RepID=A0ABZ0M5Z9_9ACTN|nr:hypothetical protein [Streptomyces sp. HUAS YS2]WOX26855.1 hypothetical protein R2D22_34915 [Streptomyces sp. HUAS YS2]
MGDARVEFYAGDRLLGRPTADRDMRSFRLPLDGTEIGAPGGLRVLAGGRRMDAAGTATPPPRSGYRAPVAPRQEAPLPANDVDPGVPGAYRTVTGEYDLPAVRLPGFPKPVEMRATVVGPTDAPGKRPVALLLHGRHYTCFGADGEQSIDWPCAGGLKPVPSHRGYLQSQKLLASQGYVTLSISANGINGQDDRADDGGAQARSSLVRLHLSRWADWSADPAGAPAAVRAVSPADLSRVLLVGHSRGGEGVNRAALDSLYAPPADQDGAPGRARWTIRGNVLIGPTIFGQNPVPDVASLTLLPGCDGDVSDLQGQIYVDGTRGISKGAALHSAAYVLGANHNFFNTEWTPGQAEAPADDDFWSDDTPDPVCSPGTRTRLTAAQQQTAGATYIAAAARLFVARDDKVRPLLDGTGRRAPSAGPARVLTHAVGGNRTSAFLPGPSVKVTGGGRLCAQIDPDPNRSCLRSGEHGQSPHFAGWETSPEPGRDAVALRWPNQRPTPGTHPGTRQPIAPEAGSATDAPAVPVGVPVFVRAVRPVSFAAADDLALRVIVPPNSTSTTLHVAVADAAGRRAALGRVDIDGLPGTARTASYWGRELRVPLTAARRAGLDLTRIGTLELRPQGRGGQAWLMDAWGWRPGTPAVRPAAMPRIDIGRLTVDEGDSGERTVRIPVQVSGSGSGRVRLFVPRPGSDEVTSRIVTVRQGVTDIDLPVTVRGNTRYGYDETRDAFVKAVGGAIVGSHRGGVTVRNDDPMPKAKLTPVAADVTEGRSLTWRMTLSAPADVEISGEFGFLPVTAGTELSTLDVDKRWLADNFGRSPSPARPLSSLGEGTYLLIRVPAGRTSADVHVPTVADEARESAETLRARLTTYDDVTWEPHHGPAVTGTVRDAS